jgi:hypothetical protein
MAIYDIIYTESDYFIMELTGSTGNIIDILFDNPLIDEIVGINGTAKDIIFDENTLNEIPNVLITDFGFIYKNKSLFFKK